MPPLTDRQLSLSLKTKHTRFSLIFACLSSSVSFPDLSYKWLFFLCFSYRPFLYISLPTHIPVYFLITVGVYLLIAEGRISVFSHYSVDAMPKRGLGRCSSTFVDICPSLNVCVFLWFRSFPTVFWFLFSDFSALGSSGCLFLCNFRLQIINFAYLVYYVLEHLCAGTQSRHSCPTLCDPMDCSPSGSSVPRIL